ncbi:type I restriction enzyme HsdR N-terminal domain-containing protein, partial [bacterium]|nr:type I restriction enzyme HsdR N-terminal domain-containing protein [bacterium]
MENCTLQDSLEEIHFLVEGFRANLRNLRDEHTPEAVIRQEYIDTFWKLLRWDVANDTHRSLAEKDVVIEATVGTLEGERMRSRRPDYIFRIDGFPRFVVEAKPPYINILTDRDAIFQAKTYAWSAQIPFVVLTNFEQFRLFDATMKPYHTEPNRGIISDFDLRFEDYTTQWDVLWKTFSRSEVASGSLEQLLAKIKQVRAGRRIRGIDRMLIDLRGTEPVDRVFLQHLEDFRLRFARALYKENQNNFPEANTHHGAARLTEATQRLIDRLVFIRVCEDRDITSYGELRDIVNSSSQNRLDLYSELTVKFRRFDEEYNGYLFKPHFSEQLKVSPELLADFIRSLYPPDGAYRFDAIGDDLLGIIYERFLGSVITVKRNHVEAEPKPEVRHAGGVYYTPRFVVDTI